MQKGKSAEEIKLMEGINKYIFYIILFNLFIVLGYLAFVYLNDVIKIFPHIKVPMMPDPLEFLIVIFIYWFLKTLIYLLKDIEKIV